MLIPALLIGGLLLMAGGGGAKGKRRTPTPGPTPTPTAEEAQAIVFCESEGGSTASMEDAAGNIHFVCTFPNGRMVDAMAYYHGEASPECPIEMVFDPQTQTCVPAGEIELPVDPNYEICLGALLAAWVPTENYLNIPIEVAVNVYAIMFEGAKDEWAPYHTPEALADFGMTYVVPECDWIALREYTRQYMLESGGVLPGAPEDIQKGNEVYESVFTIAKKALADASIDFDVQPAPPTPDIHQQPGPPPPKPKIQKKCPPNYFYDALHDVCCPDGFFWHVGDQMCRPEGYSGRRRKRPQGNTKAHRVDMIRNGFAGGCGGRRGHCGVRRRAA